MAWNIILCGDISQCIAVYVPDPSKWTVKELKQQVTECVNQKDVKFISEDDVTFYLGKNKVPEDKLLKDCPGMKNGVGLVAKLQPYIINVYCPDVDVTLVVEIPKSEFRSWKVATLLEAIYFKLGIKSFWPSNVDILCLCGSTLNTPEQLVSQIPGISDQCLMTFTRFERFDLPTPKGIDNRPTFLPLEGSRGIISRRFRKSQFLYNRGYDDKWLSSWRIVLQQLDGSKTTITLDDPHNMSVMGLRYDVMDALSVPTHQQRLTLGNTSTVLEDWKHGSNSSYEKLITDYNSFCDGITLYLVQLTGGISVAVENMDIDIHDPSKWTLEQLAFAMKNTLGKSSRFIWLKNSRKYFTPSDEPVSSVEWITDGCTLTYR